MSIENVLNKEQERGREANIPELRKYRIIKICFIKPIAILDKMECIKPERRLWSFPLKIKI